MNGLERLAYRHIRSFRREAGGLHAIYVAIYSRIYGVRMRYLHRHGRHHITPNGIRCGWCGHVDLDDPLKIWNGGYG